MVSAQSIHAQSHPNVFACALRQHVYLVSERTRSARPCPSGIAALQSTYTD